MKLQRRTIIIFIVVSLLNVGLLALLWTQLITPATNNNNSSNGTTTVNIHDPLVGHAAPDFALNILSAQTTSILHLSSYKGKPVVLNVWASWCDPCNREAPLLQSTWKTAQAKGVVFIGLDFQDTQNDGLKFVQQYGITYTNVVDADGSVAISYGVVAVPESFFIDKNGVIVSAVRGELTTEQLTSSLQKIS